MEKKRISVFVAGQRFNLITDDDENYVRELASRVDARVNSLVTSGDMSRERAAVMAALDLADDVEKERKNLGEVRGQVKEYLTEAQRLGKENDELKAELSRTKLDVGALDSARKTIAEGLREREALKSQVVALKEQISLMQQAQDKAERERAEQKAQPEEAPAPAAAQPEEKPAQPEKKEEVTAEDDLFFDLPQDVPVKPAARKEKKNRHDHSHVNPYKQQFMQKQGEQKGYTQQRQYSLFDTDE